LSVTVGILSRDEILASPSGAWILPENGRECPGKGDIVTASLQGTKERTVRIVVLVQVLIVNVPTKKVVLRDR
jgi:hypothetical protein